MNRKLKATRALVAPRFHFCRLCGRLVKHGLKIGASMLPRHINCLPHGINYDDELGGPAVLVPPKGYDVSFKRRHSGVEHSRKQIQGQGGLEGR